MIREGAYTIHTISEFVKEEQLVNLKGDFIGFNKPIFQFAQKYLINKSYSEFVDFRRSEVLNERTKHNGKIVTFLKSFFITKQDLVFLMESYQYHALCHYFNFLPPIIRNERDFNHTGAAKHYYYFSQTYKQFYQNFSFIDERTFSIIQKYAKEYIEWVDYETKNNKKLKIKRITENF